MSGSPISVAADLIGIIGKLQSLGFCSDVGIVSKCPGDVSIEELRWAFNHILSLFLTEIHSERGHGTVPVMIGGKVVDLFKLYLVVRRNGGYESVSAWAAVAEEIGLDSAAVEALKLVYGKYLNDMDRWLREALDEVTAIQKCLLVDKVKNVVNGNVHGTPSPQKMDFETPSSSGSTQKQFLTHGGRSVQKLDFDDVDDAANGAFSLKRKRSNLKVMLTWMRGVASKFGDPSLTQWTSSVEKYHDYNIGELFSQAIMAREAHLSKRNRRNRTDGALVQETPEQRLPSADFPGAGNRSSEKTTRSVSSQTVNKQADYRIEKDRIGDGKGHLRRLLGNESETEYYLGPYYQAEMPEWTAKPSPKSDNGNSKWLGTRIWPPESQVNATAYEHQPIGKGRQETCQCKLPGSVECVRFHVADKRFQLNRELGPAFHSWGLTRMGEEVAVSWTEDEQRAFKGVVRRYPLSKAHYDGKKIITLWGELCKEFRRRGIKNIVRYYFNVLVLARRSYQNRMTPRQIDSDDDEPEYDFVSRPYGHYAVRN